jgi:uncharacterized protein (TIGR00369 family)
VDDIRKWVEESGFGASLGVVVEDASEDAWRFKLPYADHNSNPGKALHGGCMAALGLIGGQAVTRANLGAEAGGFHTAGLQVNYLAAVLGEDVIAEAKLLRRGKSVCFVEVDVTTGAGKSIAHVTSMVRGRFGAKAPTLPQAAGDDGTADPGPMGPHVGKMPYTAERGLNVERMTDGRSRIRMARRTQNADAEGGVHEGAALALFDTTGAMAAWAETGPGAYRASTPSLQAQILYPPKDDELIAYGTTRHRDDDAFWCDVEVAGASDGQVVVRGTVMYRIVT